MKQRSVEIETYRRRIEGLETSLARAEARVRTSLADTEALASHPAVAAVLSENPGMDLQRAVLEALDNGLDDGAELAGYHLDYDEND